MSKHASHHQDYLYAMRRAMAAGLAALQDACDVHGRQSLPDAEVNLKRKLRMAYETNFLDPLRHYNPMQAIPENRLGQIYGAFFLRMESIFQSWKTSKIGDNKAIDLRRLSRQCCRDAAMEHIHYHELVLSLADELQAIESELEAKAAAFAQAAHDYLVRMASATSTASGSKVETPVFAIRCSGVCWKQVSFEAITHDGVEPVTASLSDFFQGRYARSQLLGMAKEVFGDSAQLDLDRRGYTAVTLEDPDCCKT